MIKESGFILSKKDGHINIQNGCYGYLSHQYLRLFIGNIQTYAVVDRNGGKEWCRGREREGGGKGGSERVSVWVSERVSEWETDR